MAILQIRKEEYLKLYWREYFPGREFLIEFAYRINNDSYIVRVQHAPSRYAYAHAVSVSFGDQLRRDEQTVMDTEAQIAARAMLDALVHAHPEGNELVVLDTHDPRLQAIQALLYMVGAQLIRRETPLLRIDKGNPTMLLLPKRKHPIPLNPEYFSESLEWWQTFLAVAADLTA